MVPSASPQSVTSETVTPLVANVGATLSVSVTLGLEITQEPLSFLTRISYTPPARPVKLPPLENQSVPPLMLYSKGAIPPEAVMVMVPSVSPQSVGSVKVTSVISGEFGATKVIWLMCCTKHVPSSFLTWIVYVSGANPVNNGLELQVKPPSILNSGFELPFTTLILI